MKIIKTLYQLGVCAILLGSALGETISSEWAILYEAVEEGESSSFIWSAIRLRQPFQPEDGLNLTMLGEFDEVFDCPVYFRPGPLAPQPADLQTSGATSLQRIESFCERFPRANSFLQISPIIGFSDFSALLGPQFVHPKSNSFGILLSLVAERKASDPGLFLRSLAQYALKNTILDQDAFNAVIGSIEKKDFGSALSQICASSDIQPKDIEVSKTQFLIIFTTAAKRNAVLNFFSALSASNMY